MIQNQMFPESFFVASLAIIAMLRHREGEFFLDKAFAFIEGTPARRSIVMTLQ